MPGPGRPAIVGGSAPGRTPGACPAHRLTGYCRRDGSARRCSVGPRSRAVAPVSERSPAVSRRGVERIGPAGGTRAAETDDVVVEAALEIRAAGAPLTVVLRTPGDDVELVRGLL